MFLEILQNSQENTCARVSFSIQAWGLQEYQYFKNTFFTENLWMTTSGLFSFYDQAVFQSSAIHNLLKQPPEAFY